MKPLAMSFQLVMDKKRRLAAEVEIVFEDGSTATKRVPANERMTFFFGEAGLEELVPPVLDPNGARDP